MGNKYPKVSIIIVTYNSSSVISDCLSALAGFQSNETDFEVILVDNASRDDSVAIGRSFPIVKTIVALESNTGFARAVTAGAELALGNYICLLNPDALATKSQISQMANWLDTNENDGVVAPTISHPDGRLRVISAGHQPTVWRMFTHYSGTSRLGKLSKSLEGHYLLPNQAINNREVGWVTGACLMIRRSVWDSIGGISHRWFMYAEDIELCARVVVSGYKVRMLSSITVLHSVGESSGDLRSNISSAWILNLFDYYKSNISRSGLSSLAWKWVVIIGLLSRAIAYKVFALSRQNSIEWSYEARKFFKYAKDLHHEPSNNL